METVEVACPACRSVNVTEPEWRLLRCSHCGREVLRMEIDPDFD